MDGVYQMISTLGAAAPMVCVGLFLLASLVVVWRLEVLSDQGVEGTVLGTVFMPFCSGMGNIVFALVLAFRNGDGADVLVNCLFNNITNLTVLIGVPVLIWSMASIPRKKSQAALREHKMGRFSLVLTLVAALFFSLCLLLVSGDGVLSRSDGLLLIGLFLFWQSFHVYDVKKTNLLKKQRYPKTLPVEVVVLLAGAFVIFVSTDWLVGWFQSFRTDVLPPRILGWASGVLTVLPNALLAFYYGARDRMDVVYASQVGDAHVCIPLCIGLFAAVRPIPTSPFLQQSLWMLMGLCGTHLVLIATTGRLPRVFAAALSGAFFWFLWTGMAGT